MTVRKVLVRWMRRLRNDRESQGYLGEPEREIVDTQYHVIVRGLRGWRQPVAPDYVRAGPAVLREV